MVVPLKCDQADLTRRDPAFPATDPHRFDWTNFAITVHGPVSAVDLSVLPAEEWERQSFQRGTFFPKERLDEFCVRYEQARGSSVKAFSPTGQLVSVGWWVDG